MLLCMKLVHSRNRKKKHMVVLATFGKAARRNPDHYSRPLATSRALDVIAATGIIE